MFFFAEAIFGTGYSQLSEFCRKKMSRKTRKARNRGWGCQGVAVL
jgi:hypothetical protein